MTRPLTPEEQRDPGTALAKLLAGATVERLTIEEAILGLAFHHEATKQLRDEAQERVDRAVRRALGERAA